MKTGFQMKTKQIDEFSLSSDEVSSFGSSDWSNEEKKKDQKVKTYQKLKRKATQADTIKSEINKVNVPTRSGRTSCMLYP